MVAVTSMYLVIISDTCGTLDTKGVEPFRSRLTDIYTVFCFRDAYHRHIFGCSLHVNVNRFYISCHGTMCDIG